MSAAAETQTLLGLEVPLSSPASEALTVRKRDGRTVPFDESRVAIALEAAFRDVHELGKDVPLEPQMRLDVDCLTQAVVQRCVAAERAGRELEIELIQDVVETELMRAGQHLVARGYILFREERRKARLLQEGQEGTPAPHEPRMMMTLADGTGQPLNVQAIRREIIRACAGYESVCDWRELAEETLQNLYDGVKQEEIEKAMLFAAKARVERDPAYSYVASRLLLNTVYREVFANSNVDPASVANLHRERFAEYVQYGVEVGRLDSSLLTYDLPRIAAALRPERDRQFQYMGMQTVYDRYLLHHRGTRIEVPQYFWMRVAMGLALVEGETKNERAIEFYELLSTFRFTSSTPTLFNSGTLHPQLSSCYLSTVMDDLDHIFKVISDDAKLSKWAGGLGNDWTNVRATGSLIRGTNGESQGVVPFLKVANDTAVAVNQGGKRKGAMCAYLETWHLDIEDFLELRKNTGDERRRTHDMNTANWIPDLFMQRVQRNESWTLFSPSDVPDLHDLYGKRFGERYAEYEAMAERGEITLFKKVQALDLWKKMIAMLFETGHPWITFKDPSNIASPQDHMGVVHSSNLCTEILLNTTKDEVAVCNLGSVNLAAHVTDDSLDYEKLETTVRTAMRMLDNVIDINYYPIPEARRANLRHRPVGLGLMGFQDALYKLGIPYASEFAVDFADQSMEAISYYAILASTELARERGAYETFKGSKWDRGLLPMDAADQLAAERGEAVELDRSSTLDWTKVRLAIQTHGMRNSNCMAIAPTATISNIVGVSQSIEPMYKNLFVKSNLSGDFATINEYLVNALKERSLWDPEMVNDLKYYDGEVHEIERIPDDIKEVFRTAFQIDPHWLVECASRRQKWIDMGQSLNLYMNAPNGRKLNDMYFEAWKKGLKTTYYLRTLAATQVEKSTVDVNRRGIQPKWMKNKSASANIKIQRDKALAPTVATDPVLVTGSATDMTNVKACSLLDPTCEACQ
ncbi:MAG: ribonucleoside-diphosphate reductase subunit alpha [Verrucomicrobia bacterium]|nr:ribonucleoside-diphosphate reductase subunit alpha [Verrucomicrobiota bacterium]